MIRRRNVVGNGLQRHGGILDALTILSYNVRLFLVPRIEMFEFYGENRSLYSIHSFVVSDDFVRILFYSSMRTQFRNTICHTSIVRDDTARFTARAEIFTWIEAKASNVADTADHR